jgi:Ca2+:H+ antiporter
LSPTNTAPPRSSGVSDGDGDGDGIAPDALRSKPETGETTADIRQARAVGETSGTTTQATLRRRASGREQSSDPTAEQSQAAEKPKKQRTFFKHIVPKEPFTARNQIQRTLFGSWINILLVAAPAGIAINYIPSVSRVAVFIVNFIAIVPLAAMLGFATEEIALRTGETLGGLLNATFGYVTSLSSRDRV